MCIIAVKKPGVPFPSEDTIRNMWVRNPDGAGIMYTDGSNRVTIDKGYMKLKDFNARLDELKREIDIDKETVVLHFRIGTSGGNTAENTHPFPISKRVSDLKALRMRTKIGIAHNGIIKIERPIEGISDTMEYIRTKLYSIYMNQHWFFKNKDILDKIERQITSKMVFLEPTREVQLVGKFITDKDGMIYSNSSYEGFKYYGVGAYGGYYGYYGRGYDSYGYNGYYDPDYDEEMASLRKKYGGDYGYDDDYAGYGSKSHYIPKVMELSPVNESNYIVFYDSGDMMEVCDIILPVMIDKSGHLYVADFDDCGYEVAYPIEEDCASFDENGNSSVFDENEAIFMEVDTAPVSAIELMAY